MNQENKNVLIIGGGFAGTKAAVELMNVPGFSVTLMTPKTHFEYHGAMYRSATGRSPLEVVIPLREVFQEATNVTLELDSMAELRVQTKEVEGSSGRVYSYDILVMAVGYEVNYFGIEGMAEHSQNMYSIQAAIELRHRLVALIRDSKPEHPPTISVVGAGPTGIEIVSDLQNFANLVAQKRELPQIKINTRIIEAAERVMPGLSEAASSALERRLNELHVDVMTNTRVMKCEPYTLTTDRGQFTSDITIWTAGNKAHSLFTSYPTLFSLNERGRVVVNEFLQANSPDIFVIGDAADTPYSGMAQTAIHHAIHLTDNLKRYDHGDSMEVFEPKKPAYVIPAGEEWALLDKEGALTIGEAGWKKRREADEWVLNNFLAYELAQQHYKQGDKIAQF